MSPTDPKHRFTKAIDPYPVRCIDPEPRIINSPIGLTKGKAYMVVAHHVSENKVQVYNDHHVLCLYDADRFEKLPLCKYCGDVVDLHFHDELNKILADNQECHSCNFWREIYEQIQAGDNTFYIVDGEAYHDSGRDAKDILGYRPHGGAEFYIMTYDSRFINTNGLWHRGTVPVAWQCNIRNNAVFLSPEDWRVEKEAHARGSW